MGLRQKGWAALAFGVAVAISLLGWVSGAGAQIITEYPVSNSPTGIVAGPDGALWFTVEDCNPPSCNAIGQIGRITTSGAATEYNVPEPFYITVGPDGALWFTDLSGIGRITTAGVVTQYPGPAGSDPTGIGTGPDGALWFGDNGTNAIGRITTSGAITEYPLPTGCSAGIDIAITPGPDGALWFTLGEPFNGGVQVHRAHHDLGNDHRIRDPQFLHPPNRDHGWTRRRTLVHRAIRRHRAHHHSRHDHRIPDTQRRERRRDRRRARWRAVVHRSHTI